MAGVNKRIPGIHWLGRVYTILKDTLHLDSKRGLVSAAKSIKI
jgi:hypothetical protein